ncbi:hypothetical protein ACMV5I_28795, partial [Serratia sp. T13T92]
ACVADGAEIAGRRHRLGHAAALENHPTLNPTTEHCGDLTTLTLNQLCWKTSEMGPQYAQTCQGLVDRQDALKDYVSIIEHPERSKIFRAID